MTQTVLPLLVISFTILGFSTVVESRSRARIDGVNQITQAFKELQQIGKDGDENFVWHESNVQTWVSDVLTDATMCIDGILKGKIDRREQFMIKARFLNVKQLASNSLAMFSHFTTRYRASRGIKNPKQKFLS
ncbi:hypothetical protein R6Q57_007445 [Mikania cordata]